MKERVHKKEAGLSVRRGDCGGGFGQSDGSGGSDESELWGCAIPWCGWLAVARSRGKLDLACGAWTLAGVAPVRGGAWSGIPPGC